MKKTSKIFATLILMLFLCTTVASAFANNDETIETNEIIFELSFQEPQIKKVNVHGEIYDKITIKGLKNTHDYKVPCLPVKSLKILLPPNHSVKNIKVITSDKISLGENYNVEVGGRLLPLISTQLDIDKQNPITTIQSSQNFTNSLFSNVGVYSYRGFPILHVNLYPVEYELETGELFYYDYMKLVVETEETIVSRALRGLSQDYALVEKIVDNPNELNNYKSSFVTNTILNSQYDYIIITNNKLKNSDEEYTLQDLMDYKESQGFNPLLITVVEIMLNPDYKVNGKWGDNNPSNPFYTHAIIGDTSIFDDKAARIRNYIRYAYYDLGAKYVLLVGDADVANNDDNIIPLRGLFANESGLPLEGILDEVEDDIPSDVYYACLDGNFNYDGDVHFGESADRNSEADIDEADLYSEIWVGRACADSEEEVSNFVMKSLKYEQYVDDPYLSEILFVGEDLGTYYPFFFRWGGEYKDLMEDLVPSQYNLNKFYDIYHEYNDWDPYDLIEQIYNVPPQLINHDGHGYTNYMLKMGSYSFYELENEKPFFIYSHSCLTGSFDNFMPGGTYVEEDCIAEILTCEIPYGAFACILNARYGLGSENSPVSPSGAIDESFYEALFTENIKDLGHANHYSKEDNVWRIDQNGFRWAYYQTNLFGDPSLFIKDPAAVPPNKPSEPQGEKNGNVGVTYTYNTSTTDPKDSQLFYLFDWDDGTTSGWVGPYASGEIAEASHSWKSQGSFEIRVKAKNSAGLQSEWSDPNSISMPKKKTYNNTPLLLRFLQNHPNLLLILKQIMILLI